jgi:ATP-binding cassette, subfamily B, bacterial
MIKNFTTKIEKLKTNLNLLRTLKLVFLAARGWAALSIALIVVESILFFLSLYLLKLLVDKVSMNKAGNGKMMTIYIIAAGIAGVLYVAVKAISNYATEVQAVKVSEYIDDKIHTCATGLDLSFYESPDYFDILKRAKDAGPERPNAIVTNLIDIAKNGMMLLAIGSILVSIDWLLLPLLVLFVLPTMFVRIHFAEKLHERRVQQTALERKSSYLSSLITSDTSAKEIRSLGLGNYLRSIYQKIRLSLLAERFEISRKSTVSEIITTGIATIGFFSAIAYIVTGVGRGKTSIGDITLFLIAFPQSYNLMQALSSSISKLYQNSIFVSGVFDLFDLKPILSDDEDTVAIPADKNIALEIKCLNFAYPHAKEPALRDISLRIPSGKIVAVVGLNGAGKTTLIKLLSRLYDPTSGEVCLGGIDIRHFKIAQYRKQISTVFQDFGRYNVTVADNIRFGDIDAIRPEEDIIEAAKNSGAHGYIKKLPEGYSTMMGRIFEDGHEVSIGQWQKLAIARALYSRARFLILDEATSALDAMAERELFQSFRQLIGDKGALIISHRISAVEHADYIYVLSEGQVRQSGTHEELLQMEGDYARLFKKNEKIPEPSKS